MSARTSAREWKAVFNRYTLGDTVSWSIEVARPDALSLVVASVHGDRRAEEHQTGVDLSPAEAREVATMIAAVPALMRSAELTAMVLARRSGDLEQRALAAAREALAAARAK